MNYGLFFGLLALAVVTALLFIVLSYGQRSLLSLALKAIASFCFVLLGFGALLSKGISLSMWLMIMGLIASIIGDVVLALPDMNSMEKQATTLTLMGGLAFAVAHIFYISGMIVSFGFRWWIILIAIALGLIFFFGNKIIGKLDYGPLNAGMPFYATFVSLVVAESVMSFVSGTKVMVCLSLLIGFVLFWLSDIVLMNIYFGKKTNKQKQHLYYYNLAFYYGAQILIAVSLWL